MRKTLSLLLIASLAAAASACVTEDEPNIYPECPAERSYRCGDDSCAAEAEACPIYQDDDDYWEEDLGLAGEVLAMSPGSVQGDNPEAVRIDLRVDDPEALDNLIDRGAIFQISLKDSTGEEILDVDEANHADGFVELVFTPSIEERVRIRKQVQVRLAVDDGEGQFYSWGSGHLAFPADVGDLDFDGRRALDLEGITDLQDSWSGDLDGDGIKDLVVIDGQGASRHLVVFRCDDEKCSNEGEVAMAADGDIGGPYEEIYDFSDILNTGAENGGGDEGAIPFVIAYPSLSDVDENLREIEHLVIRLVEGDEGIELVEERISMTLPVMDGRTWLANTIKPRLISDDNGEQHAGISIFARDEISDTTSLSHVLLQQAMEPISQTLYMGFDGLQPEGQRAALRGQISTCPIDELYQQGTGLPDGRFVSTFEIDGSTMAVIGSSASGDQMIVPRTLPESIQLAEGSAKCELADLDGDGHLDVAFSVKSEQGHALMVSLADADSPQLAMEAPQLVMDGLSDDWSFHRDENDELRLTLTRENGNPDTGEQPEITHEIGLEVNTEEDAAGNPIVHVTVTNQAPTTTDHRVNSTTTIMDTGAGHRLMISDKCGEDGICSPGLFLGSEQMRSTGGSWIAAHFSGGLIEGDESSLLQEGDPKTIIGWLSSTGPFLPLATEACCFSSGKATPVIINTIPNTMEEDDEDNGVEAHVVHLIVNDDGEATGLRLQDLAIIDGEPQITGEREIELDFSQTEMTTRNVVKFKAGAELSKSIAVSGDDCPDAEDGICPTPSTTLLFVMDTGELATVVLDGRTPGGGAGKVVFVDPNPESDSGDDFSAGDFFFESLGAAPVLASRGGPIGVDVWEVSTELSQGQGDERQTLTRSDSRIVFGDFQGLGHPQILEMTLGEGEVEVCGSIKHFIMAGGEGQGDLESIEAALNREGQSICIPEGRISITDLNGDRCQDLVFPDSSNVLLSRCDGTFEPELADLNDGSGHLGGDDGWVTKAQDYNATRSNKPTSIRYVPDFDDSDDDGDGIDDEVMVVLPFIDGLQRIR